MIDPGLLQTAKLFLVEASDLTKDALHVHFGLAIMLAAAILLRLSLRDPRPWAIALLAILIGETWDMIATAHAGDPIRLAANWKDVWNTMLWPTALLLLARYTRVLKR